MELWDKLRTELDRAGRVAQGALDEGKLRLEVFRARQLADKAAQTLGYAVFRARKDGTPLDDATSERLHEVVGTRLADVVQLEEQLRLAQQQGKSEPPTASPPPPSNPAGV